MKTNKLILTFIISICMVAVLLGTVACDTEVLSVDDVLSYANSAKNIGVGLTKDGEVIYSYKNATVNNPHDLDINVEDYIDAEKAINLKLTSSYLKSGYTFNVDATTGKASLDGELTNTQELLGKNIDGAKIEVVADTNTKTLTTFVISYEDANGVHVEISIN